MGYTHYWEMPDIGLGEEVIKDIEIVLERNKDLIWNGEIEENNPRVSSEGVFFNGDHETFHLKSGESGFCKTNEQPYDMAVCETLLVLKRHLGDEFNLDSDGLYVSSKNDLEKEELNNNWGKAIENVKKEFGYEFGLWKKSYYKSESGLSTEDLTFRYEASHDGDFFDYLDRNGTEYYKFEVLPMEAYNDKKMENKKGHLFMGKEFELGVVVIDEQQSENGDLHVLCERESDGSHVVWTSYNTGDLETSYENFYNGKYDLTREEGFKELDRRSGRDKEVLKGFYTYSGFDEPKKLANDLESLVENVRVDSNFKGVLTDDVLFHIEELQGWHKNNRVISDEEFEEDMKDLLYEYDIYLNPTRGELEEVNERYGLPKETYIEDAFSDKDELIQKLNKAMSMDKGIER